MKREIDVKKIIKNNPLIKEKTFKKELEEMKKRGVIVDSNQYNIIPPFTTERRIRTSI